MLLFTTRRHLSIAAIILLFMGGLVLAQRPRQNVSAAHHPNLAAAQRLQQAHHRLQCRRSVDLMPARESMRRYLAVVPR